MPDKATLYSNAQERLQDAHALYDKGRYHGAAYLCGYAAEFALKARICETLDVDPYPENERAFKIHDLDKLLLLSGRKKSILNDPARAKIWSTVTGGWTPEMRYRASASFSQTDAETIINAVAILLPLL